jgi:sugar phosphate isomerase/epimerase
MQRVLSTYLFANRKLTAPLLGEIAGAGFAAIELYGARNHFDYGSLQEVRDLASALDGNHLKLHSLHSPTGRDFLPGRESGVPLSLSDPERVRRIDAVDEIKRALDLAEKVPFQFLVQHLGAPRETLDERTRDAAFSSLENLVIFAKQRGVTIALENTTSEMGAPATLRSFIEETRLAGLKVCFDVGHAYLDPGPPEERVEKSFCVMRDLIATTHIHDNHGEKDEHLLPYSGAIDWAATLKLLRDTPVDDLGLVLELKELPSSASGYPDAGAVTSTLAAARGVFDKFDNLAKKAK